MGPLRRRVVVLLVLVLAGSGLTVALALTRPDVAPSAPDSRGDYEVADLLGPGGDGLEAAVAAVPLAFGYDHADLTGSLRAASETMTPAYAARFARVFGREVRPFAREREAVTEARVRGAGVVRTGGGEDVVCLLYVDQVLVSGRGLAAGESEVLGRNRVLVDVVLTDGVWKVDDIQVL